MINFKNLLTILHFKNILLLGLVSLFLRGYTQTFLQEDFSDGVMPPDGWSIDENEFGWFVKDFNKAGGEHPEARYTSVTNLSYSGTTRLISPAINTNGHDRLLLEFDNYLWLVDANQSKYGIATKSGGGDWNVVMERTGSAPLPAYHEVLIIDNDDVGSSNFKLCFYVEQASNSFIREWNFDNIKIYAAEEHDIAITNCMNKKQYAQNETMMPQVAVYNCGNQSETFEIKYNMYNSDGQLINTNTQTVNDLQTGTEQIVVFDEVIVPDNNELYKLVFTNLLANDTYSENDNLEYQINTYTTTPQKVVLEIGTGTWCPYCVGIALGADDLVANGHDVAVVEYHYFDDYTIPQSVSRVYFYYMVLLYPTAIFNGVESGLYGHQTQSRYESMVPFVNEALEKKSPFEMELYAVETQENEYKITSIVNKTAPIPNEDYVVYIMITESHIPENWQVLNELNFVLRDILPDTNGTVLDLQEASTQKIETFLTLDDEWDKDNLEVVAFVQNKYNQDILQGINGKLLGLPTNVYNRKDVLTNIKQIPNPFSDQLQIQLELKEAGSVKLQFYDFTGRLIATQPYNNLPNGKHLLNIQCASQLPNLSFCNITALGEQKCLKLIRAK